jgi:hypothetical protein
MRTTRRTIITGLLLALAGGWYLFDFLDNASSYYSSGGEKELIDTGGTLDPARRNRDIQARSQSANPLSAIALDSLSQTIKRPLFDESRAAEPEPQQQAPVENTEEEPRPRAEDFAVLAIVVSGDHKAALIRVNKTSEVFRLKPGDTFSGWKLTAVEPKAVVIANQDERFPLKLFEQPPQAMQVPLQQERRAPQGDQENWDEQDQEEAIRRMSESG